jgi:hypothetical protein
MRWAMPRLEDHMKTFTALVATAVILSTAAFAGTGPHRMPVAAAVAQYSYVLKTDGAALAGRPLIVSLIDSSTGEAVRGGTVSMMRPVYRGPKAVPAIAWVAESLPRDADGKFVCASEHHAAGITLRGEGPSGKSPIWLSVPVHS